MSVLEIEKISSRLESLRAIFKLMKNDPQKMDECLQVVENIDEWKYSKKQYFSPLPFENELSGYSRGSLIKKKYENLNDALKKGNYCFGFICGELRITIAPAPTQNSPLEISLNSKIDGGIRITHSVHDRRLAKPSQLRGLCDYFSIDGKSEASVGVGDRGTFYVYLYLYDDAGLIHTVRAFSKGWLQEAEYRLLYGPDGEIEKVTIGNSVIWETSKGSN